MSTWILRSEQVFVETEEERVNEEGIPEFIFRIALGCPRSCPTKGLECPIDPPIIFRIHIHPNSLSSMGGFLLILKCLDLAGSWVSRLFYQPIFKWISLNMVMLFRIWNCFKDGSIKIYEKLIKFPFRVKVRICL